MTAPAGISERQVTVLAHVADGLTYEQIGSRLHIQPDTVKMHLLRLRDRLGARNSSHAVAIAIRTGLIT